MEDNIYYVYQLRRVDEELPGYVGKGKGERAWRHLTQSRLEEDSTYKCNWIKKSIREGCEIIVEFLEENLSEQDAFEYEKFFISAYGRRENSTGCLTNLTDGGEGASGCRWSQSEEARQKISKAKTGVPRPEGFGQKMREINTGRKHSEESRKRMAASQLGRKHSKETLKKMAASQKGKVMSTEAREKISKAKTGVPLPHLKGENACNAKLSDSLVIHAFILLHEGLSLSEVAKIIGVGSSSISRIKRGENWTHLHCYYTGVFDE